MFVRATAASGTLEGAEKQRYAVRRERRFAEEMSQREEGPVIMSRAEQHSNEQLHFIPLRLIRTNGVKQVGGTAVCCEWRQIPGFDPADL